ncbi:MAG: hypothetical protein KY432_03460 [Acidobacteria bacterium]|nr:hypothetical protein [Acidobacteriota bacterium]
MLPLIVAVVLFGGCGEDAVVERPEETGFVTLEETAPDTATENRPEAPGTPTVEGTVVPADSEAEPAGEPARQEELGSSPPERPSSSPPASVPDAPPQQSQTSVAGVYNLATVDGEKLPVVTDSRPGCQIEVMSGRLTITGSDRFTISTATRETCDGRVTTEDVWDGAGTLRRDGSALHFEGASGDNFGTAEGVFRAGGITIQSFASEAGTEAVNWRFVR